MSNENDVSQVDLLELKNRIMYGPQIEHRNVLKEIKELRGAARPLGAFLAEQCEQGKLLLLGTDIVDLYMNTQCNELIEAFRSKGDKRACNIYEKIKLCEWGVVEFEPDLRSYLWNEWKRQSCDEDDDIEAELGRRAFRQEAAKALGERGGESALELLLEIRSKLAGDAGERAAKLSGAEYIGPETNDIAFSEDPDLRDDQLFLNVVREAIKRINSRLRPGSLAP
jgi:hypothetical protein